MRGRFKVVGIRRYRELLEGALFVRDILRVWKDYWVEGGRLVWEAEEGQELPLLKKVKHGEFWQDCEVLRLGGEGERPFVTPDEWVTWVKRVEGAGRVWLEADISVHTTTFGQLSDGATFILVRELGSSGSFGFSPRTPQVLRKEVREEGGFGIALSGEGGSLLLPLRRVIPVRVGDVQLPEYVVVQSLVGANEGWHYPMRRTEAEANPDLYWIVEDGFTDRDSAGECAHALNQEQAG